MKTFELIKKIAPVFLLATMASCSNDGKEQKGETKDAAKPAEQASTATTTTTATTNKNGATVSFTVNGVEAKTLPGATKDTDEPIGLWNVSNNHISLTLMGDDPKFPHRGSLTLSVDGFKAEPATYTMSKTCYAGFSRYTTENAGGETQYTASLPSEYGTPADKAEATKRKCTISFSKVEKQATEFGEKYIASGTFSATMTLSLGFKNEVSQIEIANGKFENVPVSVLGKK